MAEREFRHIVRVSNTDIAGEKAGEMSEPDIAKIQAVLDSPINAGLPLWTLNRRKDYETGEDMHLLVNDLTFTKDNDLKRMKKTKSYKGLRHQARLPVRGQRTRSNFRPNKGKRK